MLERFLWARAQPQRSSSLPNLFLLAAVSLGFLFFESGCSEDDLNCVAGRAEPCVCSMGGFGAQTCGEDGRFGPCACDGDAGVGDGGNASANLIGPAGGEVLVQGASLQIPPGALAGPTEIRLRSSNETPAGRFTLRSSVFVLEPEGLALAVPGTLRLDFSDSTNPTRSALFLARASGAGWVRVGGVSGADGVSAPVQRLGKAFLADGVDFEEQPDSACARSRVIGVSTVPPANVAMAVRIADCLDRPVTSLTGAEAVVREDGTGVSGDPQLLGGAKPDLFVQVLIDLESSTDSVLSSLAAGLNEVVNGLQGSIAGRLQVGLRVFGAESTTTELIPFTLEVSALSSRLVALRDSMGTYAGRDPSGARLYGAIREGLQALDQARSEYQLRNRGGVLSTGALLVFTDGRDTVSVDPEADRLATLAAAAASPSEIVVVGLDGSALDRSFVESLSGEDAFVAPSAGSLPRELAAAGARIGVRYNAIHLLGYCSPGRAGSRQVEVELKAASSASSVFVPTSVVTDNFTDGCQPAELQAGCASASCGGLLCGSCDDRRAACASEGRCVSHCVSAQSCTGGTITNPQGYSQTCAPEPTWALCSGTCADPSADFRFDFCNMTCLDVSADPINCGACGATCFGATTCAAASCVERWTSWPMPPEATAPSNYDLSAMTSVTDRTTGLTWQRSVDETNRSWLEAKRYCSDLVLGNFSDWRLPTRLELVSLVDYGRIMPTLDEVAFPGAPSAVFWSISPRGRSTGIAWTVNFVRGTVITSDIEASNRVRCVR